jgi:hypothetical protein
VIESKIIPCERCGTVVAMPCSSHVYQVTLTAASWATSSRRNPGVLLAAPFGKPTLLGLRRSRRVRTN